MKNVKILTIESDFGAGKKGAKLGPQALLKQLPVQLIENLPIEVIDASNLEENEQTEFAHNIDSIIEIESRSVASIQKMIEEKFTPWIISGDHSNGLAAISAYKNKFAKNRLGVIWIDAHADLHSPFTSPSGNMHGMPLAAALGLAEKKGKQNKVDKLIKNRWQEILELGSKRIFPKILPSDLVFIDIRDLEKEEIDIINEMNIRYYDPESRKKLGIETIIEESIQHLSHCNHILVSFDVDSLDPEISSGTGTPVADGLSIIEAIGLLSAFLKLPNLFAFEITEINPLLDRYNPMEIVAAEIIESSFKKSGFLD